MDRTLVLEYTRVTEAAAISASAQIGRGDGMSADASVIGSKGSAGTHACCMVCADVSTAGHVRPTRARLSDAVA